MHATYVRLCCFFLCLTGKDFEDAERERNKFIHDIMDRYAQVHTPTLFTATHSWAQHKRDANTTSEESLYRLQQMYNGLNVDADIAEFSMRMGTGQVREYLQS